MAEIGEDEVHEEDDVLVVAEKGLVVRAPGEQPVEEQAEQGEGGYERSKAADSNADEAPSNRVWQLVDAVWSCEVFGGRHLVAGGDEFV